MWIEFYTTVCILYCTELFDLKSALNIFVYVFISVHVTVEISLLDV